MEKKLVTFFLIALTCVGVGHALAASRQPVSKAITGYSLGEYNALGAGFNLESALRGDDESLFGNARFAEFFHTVLVPSRVPPQPLPNKRIPAIGKIEAETAYGKLSLDDFLANPNSFAQGFIVIHHGEVVYENYPGMKPTDSHLWASTAKPLAALLIEQLIDEGKIDPIKSYGSYVPDFRGTAWEPIPVIDIMNMAAGLNNGEDDASRADPNSIANRLFGSEFGYSDPITGQVETTRALMKAAKKVSEPGQHFVYSSMDAQALVILAEEVTQKRFSDVLEERVFAGVPLDGPIQIHVSSADRLALGHGIVSSRLRDLALFGMLFTPSWKEISDRRVVSDAALKRIQTDLPSHEVFMSSNDGPRFTEALADDVISNNRQWDAVFADGDFFKLGFMGQGLYVSPGRDLVIAYFSTNPDGEPGQRYMRPIAKSGFFDK